MTAKIDEFVRRIHGSGRRMVLAATGGGSQAISTLLSVPGGSQSVLEAVVPYSSQSLTDWLGAEPEQCCSDATARAMAMAAFRAEKLAPDGMGLIGAACTASLRSDRPKHGPHRAYVAVQTMYSTTTAWLELNKGDRTRAEEERTVAWLILNQLAETCGLDRPLKLKLFDGELVLRDEITAPIEWRELLVGKRQAVCLPAEQTTSPPRVLLPGAFNPFHPGHREMAALAEKITGQRVAFELSIENVDKPPLDFLEIGRRAARFEPQEPLWLTRAATFIQKCELFPAATFVVGADTIVRIPDSRYYGGDAAKAEAALAKIAGQGCRFLVFGRLADGVFRTLDDLHLPDALRQLCRQVPEEQFRRDISSTELRKTETEGW